MIDNFNLKDKLLIFLHKLKKLNVKTASALFIISSRNMNTTKTTVPILQTSIPIVFNSMSITFRTVHVSFSEDF